MFETSVVGKARVRRNASHDALQPVHFIDSNPFPRQPQLVLNAGVGKTEDVEDLYSAPNHCLNK
jgi:hypothetical protein